MTDGTISINITQVHHSPRQLHWNNNVAQHSAAHDNKICRQLSTTNNWMIQLQNFI